MLILISPGRKTTKKHFKKAKKKALPSQQQGNGHPAEHSLDIRRPKTCNHVRTDHSDGRIRAHKPLRHRRDEEFHAIKVEHNVN